MKRFHGNTTARRFPRSSAEAFAAERYYSIEHYRSPRRGLHLAGVLLAVAAVLFVLAQVAR